MFLFGVKMLKNTPKCLCDYFYARTVQNPITRGNGNISFLGYEKIVKLLIQNGANVSIVGCSDSNTALLLAAGDGNYE